MKACPEPAEGMKDEGVPVECYSSHTYAQEPRAFVWQGQRYEVETVERAWREPHGPVFRVRTVDGRQLTLAYDEAADRWAMIWLDTDAVHTDGRMFDGIEEDV